MASNFKLVFGNKSDFGKVRQRNEDYMETFKCDFGEVFVVCDGMGGHVGGEIASRLATASIKNYFLGNPAKITSARDIITEAIKEANKTVFAKSVEDTSLKGMGTTIVVLVINDGIAYYGHVGDSRLYMIRGNNIYQMTKDHSFVQGLVDQGLISQSEAENHPRKNEITRALGIGEVVLPDVTDKGLMLYQDDKFILCTDGLSGMVSDTEIYDVAKQMTPFEACERLVSLANMAGGNDNITLQIVSIYSGQELPAGLTGVSPSDTFKIENVKENFEKTQEISVQNPVTASLSDTDVKAGKPDNTPDNYAAQTSFNKESKKSNILIIALISFILIITSGVLLYMFVFNKSTEKKQSDIKDKIQAIDTTNENSEIKGLRYRVENIMKWVYNDGFLSDNEKLDRSEFVYDSRDEEPVKINFDKLKTTARERNLSFDGMQSLVNQEKNNQYNCELKISNNNDKITSIYRIIFVNNKGEIKLLALNYINDLITPKKEDRQVTKQPLPVEKKKEAQQPKDETVKEKDADIKIEVPPLEFPKRKKEHQDAESENKNGK